MNEQIHSAAIEHLPSFITAPGSTDVLMVVTALFLAVSVVGFGVLYFRLHSLPEQVAHKGKKVQFEIVAILGLISLFTHMHIFWIVGLLLAFIDIPDFGGFLGRIAGSVERMAGIGHGAGKEAAPETDTDTRSSEEDTSGRSVSSAGKNPSRAATSRKELDHV